MSRTVYLSSLRAAVVIAVLSASAWAAALPTTTTVSSAPDPSIFGSKVTLTATVAPASATGTVTFFDGTTILGVGTLSGGMATYSTALLPAGVRSLTALYSGDASNAISVSAAVTQTVKPKAGSGFTIQTGSPFALGASPQTIAVGDFNGDGFPDVAITNFKDNTLTVLLGSASGAYTAAPGSPVALGAYTAPIAIAVGDFNGDGKADLAVATSGTSRVLIFTGNGSGGFTAGTSNAVGSGPVSLAVGDFNGDGKADVAVANGLDGTLTILLGDGVGGFTAAVGSPITVGISPQSVVAGDFNGDGKTDLAVANTGDGTVTILLGTGTGTFTTALGSTVAVGKSPQALVVADFDGNGKADLAVSNLIDGTVSILLGDGNGGFSAAAGSPVTVGTAPQGLSVGDFDGDGLVDIVVANSGDGNATLLRGTGAGSFSATAGSPFAAGSVPLGTAALDINADGGCDLMVVNGVDGTLTVMRATLVAPVLNSGPTATPSTAGVGQTVNFSVAVSGINLTYAWDFGDGTVSALAAPTHAYAAAGSFTVAVTASNANGMVSGSTMVTVNAPLVGTGKDSDGDGFSDAFELAVGTDPNDPTSTPTGGPATANSIVPLTLSKPQISLNFAAGKKGSSDKISFNGTLAIPQGFKAGDATVDFDIGEVIKKLKLGSKGSVTSGGDSLKIMIKSTKGVVQKQNAKFKATFQKGSFAATLAQSSNLDNADHKAGVPRPVVFTVIFNGQILQKVASLTYTSTAGKMGTAK